MEFPILDTKLCIQLSQFAKKVDYQDVCVLYEAAHGRHLERKPVTQEIQHSVEIDDADCLAFDTVISKINEQALAQKHGMQIDSARGSYILNQATVTSQDEFYDTLEAFYLHMQRYIATSTSSIDRDGMRTEAIDLLERTFRDNGGEAAATAMALDGIQGGIRTILDKLTEQIKAEVQKAYVGRVLNEALDTLDWNERTKFVEGALKRLAPFLPEELKNEPPEHFARHYEPIVHAYVQSWNIINHTMRTM
jgi:hypothetical protein